MFIYKSHTKSVISGAIVKLMACLELEPKNTEFIIGLVTALLRCAMISDDWQWSNGLHQYLSVQDTLGLLYKTGEFLQIALEIDNKCFDTVLATSLDSFSFAPTLPILGVVSMKSSLLTQLLSALPIDSLTITTEYLTNDKSLFEPAVMALPTAFPKIKVTTN